MGLLFVGIAVIAASSPSNGGLLAHPTVIERMILMIKIFFIFLIFGSLLLFV